MSIEPFIDNIYRIHKAATLERTQRNIVLIQNALFNKRNETKLMNKNDQNLAAQGLAMNKERHYDKDANNKYLVETILLDDIIAYLPKQNDGSEFKTAIMKIDIEGFEAFALQKASKLFDRLDIKIIFMEWDHLLANSERDINEMISFLTVRGYKPCLHGAALELDDFLNWPSDISWMR